MSEVFHLNNKEAERELKVNYNNENLPFCTEPIPRSNTTTDRWGVGATTLRTTTVVLAHSTAEYCAPVWCPIAHIRLIDPAIKDTLLIVTGCLRPTPACKLPILAVSASLKGTCKSLSLVSQPELSGYLCRRQHLLFYNNWG